jgi:hypothetical protein
MYSFLIAGDREMNKETIPSFASSLKTQDEEESASFSSLVLDA